jgi:putative endonuclease
MRVGALCLRQAIANVLILEVGISKHPMIEVSISRGRMYLDATSTAATSYNSGVKNYYVYILSSRSGTLYVGVTSNIRKTVHQHKSHLVPGFTDKYDVDRLLYFEPIGDAVSAIKREKQIKKWRREKKVALIDSMNPDWKDLSQAWYD